MAKSQLWKLHRNVLVPDHAVHDPSTGTFYPLPKLVPAVFSFRWPNKRCCILVELYLEDRTNEATVRSLDGGSLKTEVSHLTHLVRFCWSRKIDFWDLSNMDFMDFVTALMDEKHPKDKSISKRNNDTVELIIDTSLRFLRFLQDKIFIGKTFVGPHDENPNIPLKKKVVTDHRGNQRTIYKYDFSPPPSTPKPKKPISRDLRNRLWTAVSEMSDPGKKSKYYVNRFRTEEHLLIELNYLKKRRELFLELLEATGARPGELARVSVSVNSECHGNGNLVLTTLKRRRAVDPERKFPLDPGVAMKVELFIHKTRADLLTRLGNSSINCDPRDRLFLCSKKGTPLSETSLEKEFQRIVSMAGITDQQACISMFRHRFITNMTKLHLKDFLSEHEDKTRSSMNEADYRTILKRVAVFTDHGDENSLWNYIDLAWDELGVFDYVEPARRLATSVERSINSTIAIDGDLKLKRKLTKQQLLDFFSGELKKIRTDVVDAISAQNNSKVGSGGKWAQNS